MLYSGTQDKATRVWRLARRATKVKGSTRVSRVGSGVPPEPMMDATAPRYSQNRLARRQTETRQRRVLPRNLCKSLISRICEEVFGDTDKRGRFFHPFGVVSHWAGYRGFRSRTRSTPRLLSATASRWGTWPALASRNSSAVVSESAGNFRLLVGGIRLFITAVVSKSVGNSWLPQRKWLISRICEEFRAEKGFEFCQNRLV